MPPLPSLRNALHIGVILIGIIVLSTKAFPQLVGAIMRMIQIPSRAGFSGGHITMMFAPAVVGAVLGVVFVFWPTRVVSLILRDKNQETEQGAP